MVQGTTTPTVLYPHPCPHLHPYTYTHTHATPHPRTHIPPPCLPVCPSQDKEKAQDSRRVLTVSCLVLPVGWLVATAVCVAVLTLSTKDDSAAGTAYRQAIILHGEPPPHTLT